MKIKKRKNVPGNAKWNNYWPKSIKIKTLTQWIKKMIKKNLIAFDLQDLLNLWFVHHFIYLNKNEIKKKNNTSLSSQRGETTKSKNRNFDNKTKKWKKKYIPSNNIHGRANLRVKKPFKREIDLRENPKSNTSRTKRKVDMRRW